MIVEKYIRNLLYEHDCVVIPDFGGFIAHYISASVHPIRHTFVPPSKEIAFNEMLKLNDGLLISYVASGEGVSREEAANVVRKFTESVKDEIRRNQKYVFEEIGVLTLSYEQKLQFEPFNQINYLSESFGLPELMHKPIDRVPVMPRFRAKDRPVAAAIPVIQEQSPASEDGEPVVFREIARPRYRIGLTYLIGIPAVFGLASLTGYFWFLDNDKALSSFNPFHSYIESRAAEEDSLFEPDTDISFLLADTLKQTAVAEEWGTEESEWPDEAVETGVVADNTPEIAESPKTISREVSKKSESAKAANAENIAAKKAAEKKAEPKAKAKDVITDANATPRYYVIVGGFGVKENAFKLVKQLAAQGYTNASVLQPTGKGLHKVAAGDYAHADVAAEKASQLKGEYSNVWVFKF